MEQKIPDNFRRLCEYHCPRYEELPHIALYKDQVVSVLNEAVSPFYPHGETPVTATMVNNYVKMKLLSPPEKKKYSTEQIACLYVIFLLKQVLSISEIAALLHMQQSKYETSYAYGRFCEELEAACGQHLPHRATWGQMQHLLRRRPSFCAPQCALSPTRHMP